MRLVIFCIVLLLILRSGDGHAQQPNSEDLAPAVAENMGELVTKLGTGVDAAGLRDLFLDWGQNPEVKAAFSYPKMKKLATIRAVIWRLQENDERIFADIENNSSLLATMIITRYFSYSYLRELTDDSDSDILIRNYLDGELADLRLLLNHTLSYGLYVQSREQRNSKLDIISMTDEAYDKELLATKIENKATIVVLANKTTGASLWQTCTQNMALCAGLQIKK